MRRNRASLMPIQTSRKRFVRLLPIAAILLSTMTHGAAFGQAALPHLRAQGTATQFIVDGEPFLMLGGELGNSSASSADYLRPHWQTFVDLNLNTIIAPVYWEIIEPEEGRFDFALVDSLIDSARRHDMRLVLLWFGSWKNSMSSYVPAWVKLDQARFPRARTSDGTPLEILTPFAESNIEADRRAFTRFMEHLRDVDGERQTVILIQVENEIGMIPQARDHSDAAREAFDGAVPADFIAHIRSNPQSITEELRTLWSDGGRQTSGTWREVFGESAQAEEVFMAWYFGRFVEALVESGKEAYPLPMYVNAALPRPGVEPGAYPSAGPLPHLFDVWQTAAPSLDFLAPDIYFPNFVEWMARYDEPGNPLFIPEAHYAGAPEAAVNAFYVFGNHNAIGFGPFSIESIDNPTDDPLSAGYDVLRQITPLIVEHQGMGTMVGVLPVTDFDGRVDDSAREFRFGEYDVTVTFQDPWQPDHTHPRGGLIIQLDDNELLVAGSGITLTFEADKGQAGILSIYEGTYEDGNWVPGRLLNGDQSHQGRHLRIPPGEYGIQRIQLYRYH